MAFPGAWALIPAGGAALVILARNPAGLGLILTNPFARYIGLISYSLYLVHWPVLVFLRRQHAELDPSTASVALLTIFFLSALQYHLVETPLRQPLGRKKAPLSAPGAFSRTALGALAGALVVIAGAIVVLTSGGFPSRYPETVYRIASLTRQDVMLPRRASRDLLCGAQQSGTICGKIDPSRLNILVLGDSMAIDGLNIFQAAFPEANYLISEHGGCPMLLSLENIGHSYDGCDSLNKKRMADISRLNGEFDFIILSQRLNVERIAVMEQTVKEFARSGARIIVLGVGPAFRADLAPLIAEHGTMEEIESAIQKYSITSDYVVDDRLAPVVRELRGVYVQRRPFFCQDNGRCRVVMRDGSPLSFDQHHLSLQASNEFGRYLRRTQPNLLTLREASSDSN